MVAAGIGWRTRFVVGSITVAWTCSEMPGTAAGELVFWLACQRSAKEAAETTMPSVFSASRSASRAVSVRRSGANR
jgi:hypothetical protein